MGILVSFSIIVGFNLFLVYLAYTVASWGEEVDLRDGFACGILIAGCSFGASKAMTYTGTIGDLFIWLAYFIGVGLAFALTTGLPVKKAAIATAVFFAMTVVAQLCFWLLF